MTDTLTRQYHRPSALLCPTHQQTLNRWTDDVLRGLRVTCRGCRTTQQGLADPRGDLWTKNGCAWTAEQRRAWNAYHEAGHAVIGIRAGMPLDHMAVIDDADQVDGGPAAYVCWDAYTVNTMDYLAMLWAGRMASLRWQNEEGLTSAQDRVDVYAGASDDVRRAEEEARRVGMRPTAGMSFSRLSVAREWAAISRLAAELVVTGRLTGAEVSLLAG